MQVTRDKLLHDADQVEYLVSKGYSPHRSPTRPPLALAPKESSLGELHGRKHRVARCRLSGLVDRSLLRIADVNQRMLAVIGAQQPPPAELEAQVRVAPYR